MISQAVKAGVFGLTHGPAALAESGRGSGSTVGVAQLAGVPLRYGESFSISGAVHSGSQLAARFTAQGKVYLADFALPKLTAHVRAELRSAGPPSTVLLVLEGGRKIEPTSVSEVDIP